MSFTAFIDEDSTTSVDDNQSIWLLKMIIGIENMKNEYYANELKSSKFGMTY